MNTMKFTKIRNVKSPCRAHSTDAGIDFFVPEDLTVETMSRTFDTTSNHLALLFAENANPADPNEKIAGFRLDPGESILIPSGIKVRVPEGHALVFFNKSGVGSKKHLTTLAEVVDEHYEGEVHLNLVNAGTTTVKINAGDKIVQGLILPMNYAIPEEVGSAEELYAGMNSDRGEGGFGSSGVN